MKYDLIIIGGGPAGYNASERAAHGGLKTLVIEKKALGGVCLNEGCIPTKTLLYSAKLYDYAANTGAHYGVTTTGASIDHAKVVERKNKVVKTLVGGVGASLKAAKVDVIYGEAAIKGKNGNEYEVTVNGETHSAEKLLICSGSSAAVPPIKGLRENLEGGFVMTNREILDLAELPKKLIVIGGGVIGLEMVNYFSVVGTEVVVIEALDHIAGNTDSEIIALMQKNLEKKGVKFHLNCKVVEVKNGAVIFDAPDGQHEEKGDKCLCSIGRRANTAGLGLENIGVALERGAIITDDRMKTNVPNVYAAGDVNGKVMLAHTGYREGEVAVNNMLGHRDVMRYDSIPAVIYTNPEVGSVGETEASAKAKALDVEVIKLPMQYSGRYVAENDGGNGICKLIIDKKTRVVLGAHVYANYASEFIVSAGMMVEMKMRVDDVKNIVFPHPTVSEIFREGIFMAK